MISVSHSLHRVLRGRRAEQADAAGRVGTAVGHDGFSEQRLDDRTGHSFGELQHFVARAQAPASGENGDLRSGVDQSAAACSDGRGGTGCAAVYRSALCFGTLADERSSFDDVHS